MIPLKLFLLLTFALMLHATATLTTPVASKPVHESECPCLLCWWCEPEEPPHEEPYKPPPHEEPHEPPPHEEPHKPPPYDEPELPELPPLPEMPPIPKFCPPSNEEPHEITHYPPPVPPPPHVYVYQSNPVITGSNDISGAMRSYMHGMSVFAGWGLVAVIMGYLFG